LAASIFRLVFFMVRSVYQNGTASARPKPLQNRGHFSIPSNNNNAEHAIRAFASLRGVIEGKVRKRAFVTSSSTEHLRDMQIQGGRLSRFSTFWCKRLDDFVISRRGSSISFRLRVQELTSAR
jgi:hypothetical protein